MFTWRDGSTYEGFWEGGKKTGVGVFRPTPRAPGGLPDSEAWTRAAPRGFEAEAEEAPRSPLGSPTSADAPLDSPAAAAASRHRLDLLAPGIVQGCEQHLGPAIVGSPASLPALLLAATTARTCSRSGFAKAPAHRSAQPVQMLRAATPLAAAVQGPTMAAAPRSSWCLCVRTRLASFFTRRR